MDFKTLFDSGGVRDQLNQIDSEMILIWQLYSDISLGNLFLFPSQKSHLQRQGAISETISKIMSTNTKELKIFYQMQWNMFTKVRWY